MNEAAPARGICAGPLPRTRIRRAQRPAKRTPRDPGFPRQPPRNLANWRCDCGRPSFSPSATTETIHIQADKGPSLGLMPQTAAEGPHSCPMSVDLRAHVAHQWESRTAFEAYGNHGVRRAVFGCRSRPRSRSLEPDILSTWARRPTSRCPRGKTAG